MELDDQLAALAAGELDDDTARALRARAGADPALARRLARHEALQAMLTGWDAPGLTDEAAARLDTVVDAALADLGDAPLVDRAVPRGRPTPVPLRPERDDTAAAAPAPAAGSPDVVDLGAARARREQRRGLPGWLSGTAVAAALLAVVGTGVVLGTGGFSGSDDDTLADATADLAEDDAAGSSMAGDDAEASMDESAELAPTGPDLGEGELLALLDGATAAEDSDAAAEDSTEETAEADAATDGGEEAARGDCVTAALERDTTGGAVELVVDGTYAGTPAQFVIVRSPTDGAGDRYDVLAYEPGSCALLDRDSDVR